jgi:hypothetical protein
MRFLFGGGNGPPKESYGSWEMAASNPVLYPLSLRGPRLPHTNTWTENKDKLMDTSVYMSLFLSLFSCLWFVAFGSWPLVRGLWFVAFV